MKKYLSTIVIAFIFLLGVSIFLYPTVSNFLYERNGTKAIMQHTEDIEKMRPEELSTEKEAVRRYNQSLLDNAVVLTDPFDPDAFPITDGNYEELLAQNEMMGYVEVPCIDVNIPIFHGTGEDVLEKGAGHLENTSLPLGGESSHTVISAHCGMPSARLFTDLTSVKEGDIFRIYVLDEILTYQVYEIETVEPNNTSHLVIEKGLDLATLITCTPYGQNTHRLLVHGKRVTELSTAEVITSENTPGMQWEKIAQIAAIIISIIFIWIILLGILNELKRKFGERRHGREKNH